MYFLGKFWFFLYPIAVLQAIRASNSPILPNRFCSKVKYDRALTADWLLTSLLVVDAPTITLIQVAVSTFAKKRGSYQLEAGRELLFF